MPQLASSVIAPEALRPQSPEPANRRILSFVFSIFTDETHMTSLGFEPGTAAYEEVRSTAAPNVLQIFISTPASRLKDYLARQSHPKPTCAPFKQLELSQLAALAFDPG